jgi:hypothetical protein
MTTETNTMHRKYAGLIAAAALALPVSSQAEFNYSFVELKYMETEADIDVGPTNADIDGDGIALRGSLEINENFFAFAELSDMEYDLRARGFRDDTDGESWAIGGGGHWPLTNSWDVVAKISLVNQEVGGDDDDSLVLSGGVRGLVTPQIEVDAAVEYADFDLEPFDGVFLVGEGRYNFNEQWAAGLFARLGSDLFAFGISGRFSF